MGIFKDIWKTINSALGPVPLRVFESASTVAVAGYWGNRSWLAGHNMTASIFDGVLIFCVVAFGLLAIHLLTLAIRLRRLLEPKIHVSIDGAAADGLSDFLGNDGSFSRYAQITVTPLTEVPLRNCEIRLQSVKRVSDGMELLEEHSHCVWSNNELTPKIDIPPLIKQRANFLHVNDRSERDVCVDVRQIKVKLALEIQSLGDYRAVFAVTADDTPTRLASFLFHWGGLDDVSFKQES